MSATEHRTTRPADPDAFVEQRRGSWSALEALLVADRPLHKLDPADIARVGQLYREVCADLVHVRGASFPQDRIAYLDALAVRTHGALYRAEPYRFRAVWELIAQDFPRTVRESWAYMAIACALFVIPMVVVLIAAVLDPSLATTVLPPEQLEATAQSYLEGFEQGRSQSSDTMMTGFYVYNNVGIAFRCFATGIAGGLGSAFFLVLNGLYLGATLGWLWHEDGALRNLLTFAMGHGSFELTAIVIAGGAGLRMGFALVQTRGATRLASLRSHAPALARLVLGAALMLGIAALIEGFWSPSSVPVPVKWGVAASLWVLVFSYLGFAGRARPAQAEAGAA
ncbi:MAG: stage II sporulation protein M [Myxococcota bacterium]